MKKLQLGIYTLGVFYVGIFLILGIANFVISGWEAIPMYVTSFYAVTGSLFGVVEMVLFFILGRKMAKKGYALLAIISFFFAIGSIFLLLKFAHIL